MKRTDFLDSEPFKSHDLSQVNMKKERAGFGKSIQFILISMLLVFLTGCSNHTMRHYLEPQPAANAESDSL